MKFQMLEKLEQEAKDTGKAGDDKLDSKDLATNANLLKLVITKLKGTNLDCTWFWNQLKAEIDIKNIPQITSFKI